MKRFDEATEKFMAHALGCRIRRRMAKTYDEARRFKYMGKSYHLKARQLAGNYAWDEGAVAAVTYMRNVTRELLRRYQVIDTLQLVVPPIARKPYKIKLSSPTLTFINLGETNKS